jgi:hypothetical protein
LPVVLSTLKSQKAVTSSSEIMAIKPIAVERSLRLATKP